MDVIMFPQICKPLVAYQFFLHGIISLLDATSCDNIQLLTYVEVDMES